MFYHASCAYHVKMQSKWPGSRVFTRVAMAEGENLCIFTRVAMVEGENPCIFTRFLRAHQSSDLNRIFTAQTARSRSLTAFFALLFVPRASGPHFYSVSGPLEPRQDHFDRIFTIHSREARGLTAFLHAQTPFGQAASHLDRIFTCQNKSAHFQPHFYMQITRKREKPAFLHGLQEPF